MYLLITDHFYLEKALGLISFIQIILSIFFKVSEINPSFSNQFISCTLIKIDNNLS